MVDPWGVLGLVPGSSLVEARAARRRLAKQLHPDLQSTSSPAQRADLCRRMAQVNSALAQLEADLSGRDHRPTGGGSAPNAGSVATSRSADPGHAHPSAAVSDRDCFTIAALPVDAFEVLVVVGYGVGEILVEEEPYTLQLYLDQPPCFCLLSLMPDAGGSIVTVDLLAAEDAEPPGVDTVRDLLVAEVNRLAGARRR